MALCDHLKNAASDAAVARISGEISNSGVHKEECFNCFDDEYTENGVALCLACVKHVGCLGERSHAKAHGNARGHAPYLMIRKVLKPEEDGERAQKITKLAIGVEGGLKDDSERYNTVYAVGCHSCGSKPLELNDAVRKEAPGLDMLINIIAGAPTKRKVDTLQAWEEDIVECSHTRELKQVDPLKSMPAKSDAVCAVEGCGLRENLWLCLTCGNLGCGRKNWDGSGGNGHALEHFHSAGHPVNLKLGTIKSDGSGDIFCYACDETRIDPKLKEHMAGFGIDVTKEQATVKSTKELELDQNLTLQFKMVGSDGKPMEPLFGPNLTGIRNLGNTCYMASNLQVFMHLPPISNRYVGLSFQHTVDTCNAEDQSTCFKCQMGKLADGLLSGRYSIPEREDEALGVAEQRGLSPMMIKAILAGVSPDFGGVQQQDASEYLQHLCTRLEREERGGSRANEGDVSDPDGPPGGDIFAYEAETRIRCTKCNGVRMGSVTQNVLGVPIVPDSDNKDNLKNAVERAFAFGDSAEDVIDGFQCPRCEEATKALRSERFHTSPSVLAIQARRFVFEDWVPKKLDVDVVAPEVLELEHLLARESEIAEADRFSDDTPEQPAAATVPEFDAAALAQLTSMGFSENRCKRGLLENGGNVEAAMNWILTGLDDPSLDDPLPPAGGAAPAGARAAPLSELVENLQAMGFSANHAKKALMETDNNMERAVEWIFSHPDEPMDVDVTAPAPGATKQKGTTTKPRYELFAFITHKGRSTDTGHYVCHIKLDDRWVVFNDHKVARDNEPPIGEGYLYFYEKRQG
eukprot:Clim_evm7s249 gene=Clim_evmTU7s249